MLPEHFSDLDSKLAVGSFPSTAADLQALRREAQVQGVVNLQSDADLVQLGIVWSELGSIYARLGFPVTRVRIVDFEPEDLGRHLGEAVQAVATHVRAGRKVYVHCNAGLNRSPSTVVAYLMEHRGMQLDEAVAWLEQRHDCVLYEDVIARWAKCAGS